MKKIIGLIFASFVIVGIIFSIYARADSDTAELRENVNKKIKERAESEREGANKIASEIEINAGERLKKVKEFRKRIIENNGWFEVEGESIKIKEMSEERKEIIAGKINAKTGLNLSAEDIDNGTVGQILRAYLSNGRYAIVKIMPDRAASKAVERLKAKCVERNCSVELKEFKIGNKTVAGYEVETEKDSKLFLIFNKKIKVKAVVDAETGDVINVKKPWWAFLVKEKDEEENEIEVEDRKEKVTICHVPPGNESAAHSIEIGKPALEAHLAHGDYLGECKGINGNVTMGNESIGNSSA